MGIGLLLATPAPGSTQTADLQRQIAESRLRLEEMRAERERLQADLDGARGGVRDVARELANVERQLSASRSALAELEMQLELAAAENEQNALVLATAQERHVEATATLHHRLRETYKLGPLHTVRFLLGAGSFSELINRYRYLQMLAAYDRALLQRVQRLEADLSARSRALQANVASLDRIRQSQAIEVSQLRSVEIERQRTLDTYHTQEAQALSRLESLDRNESRIQTLVEDMETRRLDLDRRLLAAGAPSDPSTLSAAEMGALDWPVEGEVLYRFGLDRRPDGTLVRWNGLGIGALPGTPVRAVRSGTVVLAGPFEGYGPTVIVSHGAGYYTLYLYLEDLGVVEGRPVAQGQVVGTVGGRETPEGPHVEFQIRLPPATGGSPEPRDPLPWLRPGSGEALR